MIQSVRARRLIVAGALVLTACLAVAPRATIAVLGGPFWWWIR
jgi:hypothetical protein